MVAFHVLSDGSAIIRFPVFAACNTCTVVIAATIPSSKVTPTTAATMAAAKAPPPSSVATAASAAAEAHVCCGIRITAEAHPTQKLATAGILLVLPTLPDNADEDARCCNCIIAMNVGMQRQHVMTRMGSQARLVGARLGCTHTVGTVQEAVAWMTCSEAAAVKEGEATLGVGGVCVLLEKSCSNESSVK